jgi:signal transduction histidine kinase/DNA-binding response OmpR family regulator/HAMP domain-containing protein
MTRFVPAGMRARLLFLILLVLLPVFGLRVFAAIDDRRAATRAAESDAYDVARLVAQDQRGFFEQSRQQLFTFAQLVALGSGKPIDARTCRPAMVAFVKHLPSYVDLGIVSPSGKVLCAATARTGVDFGHESFVLRALQSRRFAIGDYELLPAVGKPTISLAYPVVVRGRVSSIMFATLDLAALNRRTAETSLARGWVLTIIDSRGTILVRQPDSSKWIGRTVSEAPLVRAMLREGKGGIDARGVDGVSRFYGFTRLFGLQNGGDLHVTVGIPKDAALAASTHKAKRDFAVLLLVAIATLLTAWLSGRFFLLRPLDALTRTAQRLRAGDLAARTGLRRRGGELGELARTVDEMAESLESREGEIKQLNADLERRVADRTLELEAARDELESQNAELALQTAELEDNQAGLASANDELEAQRAELEGLLEELAHEKERIELLYAFGEMLAGESESDLVVHIMRELGDLAEAEVGVLYVAVPEDDYELALATTRGIDPAGLPERITPGKGLAGRAVAELRRIVVARNDAELRVESLGKEVEVGHEVHLPLSLGERTLGVVTLGRLGDRPFSDEQLETLDHLAVQTAVAISNTLAFREALRLGDINRAVLDAALDGITLTSPTGEVVLQNAAQQRLMNDLFDLPKDANVEEAVTTLAGRTTNPEHFNSRMAEIVGDPDFDGTDDVDLVSGRSYTRYTAPVRSTDGDYIGRLWIIRETTAEREVERLKTELVATVSHELRTPLSSIMGFAELLAERDYDEETRKRFVATIHGEAARLTGLVNDFLDLQRIESGGFTVALEPFQLETLVREGVELYSAQSEEHELGAELPDDEVLVLGERARIAQVLGNLLSNAIKYSPSGGRVDVRLERNGTAARVSISDQGVGIPENQQSGLFTKFFRADSSDTREIGGTGLGLALCKEIVEAHAGRIGFSSIAGKGSTFWFELPISTSSNGHREGRPLVLVVEDDPDAASLLSQYLTDADYAVETSATGEAALTAVAERPPNAICLDIVLAGKLDGWAVLSRLKENPATARIPVVICTGGNGRTEAGVLGAADFLTKPFSAHELLAIVQRVLPEGEGSVLVVDDEEAVRNLVLETLRETGYELRTAADGEEALERIAARAPDAIVLDLMLPKADGFEVLERLQADPKTRHIPVVVLTARTLTANERTLLQRRAVILMEKNSYSGEELKALIKRAVG